MLKVAWEIPGLRTLNLYQTESASITLTPKPLRQLCELYIESPLWRSKQRHLSLCLCLPSDVLHWIIDGTSTTKALLPLKYLSQSGWKEHNQGEMWKLFDHMNRENVAKKKNWKKYWSLYKVKLFTAVPDSKLNKWHSQQLLTDWR